MTPDPREILRRLPATEPDPRECPTEAAVQILLAVEVAPGLRIMYPNPVTLTN